MQSHIKIKTKFKCIIGLLDFEREKKQEILVKIKASASEFLDYASVLKSVKNAYKKQKFLTIEESFEFICALLKEENPQIFYLKIKTYKLQIIEKSRVGAEFEKKFKIL